MNATAFEKDLKYLWPFLDKLEAHAKTLSGPEAERVTELTRQSRQCFESIVGLLSGESLPQPEAKGAADESLLSTDERAEESMETAPDLSSDNEGMTQTKPARSPIAPLTVGTLINQD